MKYANTAYKLLEDNNVVEAFNIYPNIIYHQSFTIGNYVSIANSLIGTDRLEDAEKALEEGMRKHPSSKALADLYDTTRTRRSAIYETVYTALTEEPHCIDTPAGTRIKRNEIKKLSINGWAKMGTGSDYLLIESDGEKQRIDFTLERPDVVQYLAQKGMENQPLQCGFRFDVEFQAMTQVTVYLHSEGSANPLFSISSQRVFQVIDGKDHWLFLDNDSNRSADIFTGERAPDAATLKKWAKFAKDVTELGKAHGLQTCLTIAPSKEDIFPEFHPLEPATSSALDAVQYAIAYAGHSIVCPIRRLRQDTQSYSKTDTHWSDLGAWTGVKSILEQLDIEAETHFKPAFEIAEAVGDLGSKMSPPQSSPRLNFIPSGNVVTQFHNRVGGTGMVWVLTNDAAPLKKKVLIFGGSSSLQMSRLMAEMFEEVTNIVSPMAMPVREVIDHVQPDILICQTNARYLLMTPKVVDKIADSPLGKLEDDQLPDGWKA
jgi:alginate O-acetyltransferase complex protein AlgJ